MREATLHKHVTDLINSTWCGEDADVATAVLADEDAFGALAYLLGQAGDGEPDGIAKAWGELVAELDDGALDFLTSRAGRPAAFLASRVG
ncbi:hypothetical protein [Amycolatopsis minnesotensis]|uniref:Uncharacterized protein n=1 Tax=Amycolatopsis minnesotensis TaxID=337894 RepID=A0ABN2SA04_9PSEU